VTAVQPQHMHLIAACGTGMGSLAGMLKARGYHVTGSDQHVYPPMSTQLQAWGIPLYNGFSAEHLVPRPDLVIVGNAVSRDNPEAMATEQAGIPVMSLPQALAHFFIQERHSVVVTGTHGKSTTTALIAWLLQHAGYEPGFFVGAVMRNIDGTFGLGQGPHFVVEGDEYDSAYFDKGPKFLHYRPRTAVLTSLEFDHADIYRDLDHVRSAFARFIPLLPADGCLVACHDAPHVRELLATVPIAAPIQTYGLESGAEWQAVAWHADATGTHLTVHHHGQPVGSFTSPLFGPHNVHNVLAAVSSRADTYVLASPHTNFAWLDDRFILPAPFPGIASAGDILIAIGMAWFVATLMLRRPSAVAAEDTGDDAGDTPHIDDAREDAATAAA